MNINNKNLSPGLAWFGVGKYFVKNDGRIGLLCQLWLADGMILAGAIGGGVWLSDG